MSCLVYWLVEIGRGKGNRYLASGKEWLLIHEK